MNKLIAKYNKISKPAKASLWFTVSNVLQRGLLFLAVPIYTRIMTTEQYGRYSVFLSWMEIFEIIATFRIAMGGYVVGLTKFEDDKDRYTSSMQMLSIVITTAFLCVYLALGGFINSFTKLDYRFTLVIFGLCYALPAIQFYMARERVEYRYVNVFMFSVFSSVGVLAAGILAAFGFVEKDFAVVSSRLVIQGVLAIGLIWHNCRKRFTFYHKEYWNRALKFNVPLLPYYMSMVVLHSSDRIIIGNLAGESQAAVYSVAYSLSTCMQIINQSLTQAVQPWMFKKMKDEDTKGVSPIITLTLAIVAGLNVFLIAVAPEVIAIVAPPEYREATWIIPPLAASVVVMYFYQHFVNVEFYFEESRLIAVASIGAAISNVGLNYIFIPKFGYLAAGYTTLASYSIFAVCHYIFMRLVCRKKEYEEKLMSVWQMLIILIIFFAASAVLMVGYYYPLIRAAVLAALLIIGIWKRKTIMSSLSSLGKGKK